MVTESSLTGAAAADGPASTAIAAVQALSFRMGDFMLYSSSTSVWSGHENAGADQKGLNE
jgi:hypothetical protein